MSNATPIKTAAAEAPAREPLHIRLRRFHRRFRFNLNKLARRSNRVADLLYAFPGAAVALAAGERSPGAREHVIRLIEKGVPLAGIARALSLPMWLKRLPPEAFSAPPSGLPRDEGFGRNIANSLPAQAEDSALWLNRVAFALEACDPAFALWLARQRLAAPSYSAGDRDEALPLLPLAAFAWFSRHEDTAGRRHTRAPWREKAPLANAVHETCEWLNRVVLAACKLEDDDGKEENDGGWSHDAVCQDFDFVQLHTLEELREEGQRMRNCLAQYADRTAREECLIYSVRQDGSPVADLEICRGGAGVPIIAQFRGSANGPPPQDAVEAVELWFARLSLIKLRLRAPAPRTWADAGVRPCRWEEIWRPYLEAFPQFEALLGAPTAETLKRLQADVTTLKRWA